jgi:hypothetical protein
MWLMCYGYTHMIERGDRSPASLFSRSSFAPLIHRRTETHHDRIVNLTSVGGLTPDRKPPIGNE